MLRPVLFKRSVIKSLREQELCATKRIESLITYERWLAVGRRLADVADYSVRNPRYINCDKRVEQNTFEIQNIVVYSSSKENYQ